jgi:hypothetical protein
VGGRDKVCQWLTTGRWFSPGTPVSYTNKTYHYDIIEILLKVALNTIALTHYFSFISRKIWDIGKNDSHWKKPPESFIEYTSNGRESNSYCNWGLGRNCIYACKIPLSYSRRADSIMASFQLICHVHFLPESVFRVFWNNFRHFRVVLISALLLCYKKFKHRASNFMKETIFYVFLASSVIFDAHND